MALCVGLGVIYLYLWTRVRNRLDYLYYALASLGLAAYSWFEYAMLFASTPEQYGTLLRWVHIPAFAFLLFLALFLWSHLGGVPLWLLVSFIGVRATSLIFNFLSPVSLNYSSLTELKELRVLGETVIVPVGVANVWMALGQFALILFLFICIYSMKYAISVGQIRKGILTAGGTGIFILAGLVNSALIFWGILKLPLIATPFFLGIVLAMLYELVRTAADAVKLAAKLKESEVELVSHQRRADDAEEAAHEMSGRLITAQEIERARIARELHDDVSQSLALLSIKMELLVDQARSNRNLRQSVDMLTAHLDSLSSDIHRMSHELHPSKLEQLGLVAAIRGFCREIGEAHGIAVNFTSDIADHPFSPEIELCLYRITQEALYNVVKHSGASETDVSLNADNDQIILIISDNGSGFDPDEQSAKQSLGIISMNERMHLARGKLLIESSSGMGTRITANIMSADHLAN